MTIKSDDLALAYWKGDLSSSWQDNFKLIFKDKENLSLEVKSVGLFGRVMVKYKDKSVLSMTVDAQGHTAGILQNEHETSYVGVLVLLAMSESERLSLADEHSTVIYKKNVSDIFRHLNLNVSEEELIKLFVLFDLNSANKKFNGAAHFF